MFPTTDKQLTCLVGSLTFKRLSQDMWSACALLSKRNVEYHIEVELKMDEMDLTKADSKATYEEIKVYVKEKTRLKVSNLYIAQIKQKCGIIERENYNKPKVGDEMVSKCPVDKEKAIMDALEHFGRDTEIL